MMEKYLKDKYTGILMNGHTLKATREDILEVVTENETLSTIVDQCGKLLKDDIQFTYPKGKVICKVTNSGVNKILYWCACDFEDILYIIGVRDSSNKKYVTEYVGKVDQVSFLGKDIIKAIENIKDTLDDIEQVFYDTYIATEHPIADNVFYTLYIKEVNGEQTIRCSRNTALSPRPKRNG
jgi:hypothetical protein